MRSNDHGLDDNPQTMLLNSDKIDSNCVLRDAVIHFDNLRRSVKRFLNLYRHTESVNQEQGSCRSRVRTEEHFEMVRQVITDNPGTPISHLSQLVNLPCITCQQILKDDLELHPNVDWMSAIHT
ncbi:hypothetical protein NQ318_016277 [Aromia moschata]|uniref:Uncharacterized protein n=1 Tax=Aromia moschata TaxID=1265417 RepID=A0AAV8XWN2_9CUCU|nr:hypothetical protein NQ318_016277 [Aromia moschata]